MGGIIVRVGIDEGVKVTVSGKVVNSDEPRQLTTKTENNIQRRKILDIGWQLATIINDENNCLVLAQKFFARY